PDVVVTQGTYSPPPGSGFQSLKPGDTANAVQATVTQCQPQSLSLVLLSKNCTDANGSHAKNVTITSQAIATIMNPKQPSGPGAGRYSGSGSATSAFVYAGSAALSGTGCGFQSDNTVKYASAPPFSGTRWAVYASNGCVNSGSCNPGVNVDYNYY